MARELHLLLRLRRWRQAAGTAWVRFSSTTRFTRRSAKAQTKWGAVGAPRRRLRLTSLSPAIGLPDTISPQPGRETLRPELSQERARLSATPPRSRDRLRTRPRNNQDAVFSHRLPTGRLPCARRSDGGFVCLVAAPRSTSKTVPDAQWVLDTHSL